MVELRSAVVGLRPAVALVFVMALLVVELPWADESVFVLALPVSGLLPVDEWVSVLVVEVVLVVARVLAREQPVVEQLLAFAERWDAVQVGLVLPSTFHLHFCASRFHRA
ncbi:MAG: hypothetical protein AMS22_11025 [Thiotrichales bacterium SG8_50]|nr:MAG: hypothetical protein AMS22_11025 [Thiotrichales bacterium SG8_50]